MANLENLTAMDQDVLDNLNISVDDDESDVKLQDTDDTTEDSEEEDVEDTEPDLEGDAEDGEVGEDEAEEAEDDEPEPVEAIEIPGVGTVTAEEIVNWKNGSMMQSDYTKKTTELAKMREEAKDALELFNHLKQHPELVQALNQQGLDKNIINKADVDKQAIRELQIKQKELEVDRKISELRTTYGDFDESALFRKATELKTEDLETVLKSILYADAPVNKDDLMKEAKKQVLEEMKKNKEKLSTTVSSKSKPITAKKSGLTASEKKIAENMGMTEKEYSQWKL